MSKFKLYFHTEKCADLIRPHNQNVLLIGFETPLYWAYSIFLQTTVIGTTSIINLCILIGDFSKVVIPV